MTTPPPPAEPPSPQLAGLGTRLAAKLIDLAVTAFIAYVAHGLFDLANLQILYVRVYTAAEAYWSASPFLGVLLFEAALIAATAWKGKTPGRKLLRIQVVSQDGLRPPTALRAIARWALPLVATAPLIDAFIRDIPELANDEHLPALSGRGWWVWVALGWWLIAQASALWDPQRRGWHDKAAGTIVIKRHKQHDPAPSHDDLLTEWQRQRDQTIRVMRDLGDSKPREQSTDDDPATGCDNRTDTS